jgi:hypothetical protein
MNFKTKTNRITNESGGMLALRIIDTVNKSGIEVAKTSKQFLKLEEVNGRYQLALKPLNETQVSQVITTTFNQRSNLFDETYTYLEGLTSSPDVAMKAAADLLFPVISMYGKTFNRAKLANQSLRYGVIIDTLKQPENSAALGTTLLTDKVDLLEQVQQDYEELYMNRGNASAVRIVPSSLRAELNSAIKKCMDEMNYQAEREETEAWITLCSSLQQRFDELTVSSSKKQSGTKTTTGSTTATSVTTDSTATKS